MAAIAKPQKTRVTARVPKQMRDTLERAAELVGSTLNQFVMQSAFQEAQRLLEQETIIRLSQKDAKQVFALIENPPAPTKELTMAFKAAKKLVRV
jgi:uncharacterized protein (DUF1778 family)